MISFKDFKNPDGSINWRAYDEAQFNVGERCYKCRSLNYPIKNFRSLCNDCDRLISSVDKIYHNDLIRCPYCCETQVPDWEDHYSEGLHSVCCKHCDREYKFRTIIERSYESPALGTRSIEKE